MTKEDILTERKSQRGTMPEEDEKCSMGQLKPALQHGVFSKVLSNVSTTASGVQTIDKDIETGHDLHQTILFCPPAMVFKLYTFIDQLLSHETSRTVIQTVVNLFHSDAINDGTNLNLAGQFYRVLASTLGLRYGNILFAS